MLFAELGPRELHAIASVLKREELKAGDILIRPGEKNSSIYLTLSGKIIMYENYETPDQKEVRIIEANDYLNFGPNISGLPPVNTSVVVEDAEVLIVPHVQLMELIKVYPQIIINGTKLAAMKLRELGWSA